MALRWGVMACCEGFWGLVVAGGGLVLTGILASRRPAKEVMEEVSQSSSTREIFDPLELLALEPLFLRLLLVRNLP